jgi:hypothetical protein
MRNETRNTPTPYKLHDSGTKPGLGFADIFEDPFAWRIVCTEEGHRQEGQ